LKGKCDVFSSEKVNSLWELALTNQKSKPKTPTEAPPKWTDGEIKLLCSLRQQGQSYEYLPFRLTLKFRDLMTYFPGRTKKALIRAIARRGREVQEEFTEEKV
jgi:hypothetical protein